MTFISKKSKALYASIFFALSIVTCQPASSESSTPLSQLSNPVNCKLSIYDNPNHDNIGTGYLGFPTPPERLSTSKVISAAVIGVDFSDLKSNTPNPKIDYEYITKPISRWYANLSNGKMQITWKFNSKYVRMGEKLTAYNIGGSSAGTGKNTVRADEFIQQAITLASTSFDFKNIDLVVIAPPLNTTGDQVTNGGAYPMPKGEGFKFAGGEILNATIINVQEISSRQYAPWFGALPLAHEIGHLTGWTDLYDTSWNSSKESSDGQFKYMGIFSFMNYAGPSGNAIVPSAWEQWQVGFLKDSQIRCVKNIVKSTHEISNLESVNSEVKAVVIPTSPTKAIVIESRRKTGYDSDMPANAEGILVYTVDILKPSGSGAIRIVRKATSKKPLFEDAPLKSGESLEILGYRILNLEESKNSDLVSVTKLDGKIVTIPNPASKPTNSQNSHSPKQNNGSSNTQQHQQSLQVLSLGGFGTSQTEGYVEYSAIGLQSFDIRISTLGNGVEVWKSGIMNSKLEKAKVSVANLSCSDRYRITMTVYSKPDGQGEIRTTINDGMLTAINCG